MSRPSEPGRPSATSIAARVLLVVAVAAATALLSRGRLQRAAAPRSEIVATAPDGHWFEEVAASAGLSFVHHTGQLMQFPEIMSGGVCLLDFDGDGWLDVYLVQAGDDATADPEDNSWTNRLYRNRGQGQFEDVTVAAGVGDTGYGMGCTTGDIDGDGDVDLYVTNLGPDVLYRNEGHGTFRDVSASALPDGGNPEWGASAAFLDYDGDRDLDLFVTNYVRWSPLRDEECTGPQGGRQYCSPNTYQAPAPDLLLANAGDGTFRDVSAAVGLGVQYGNGLGVVASDFDGDGWIDIYVANDSNANQLWMNREGQGFVDEALPRGVALSYQGAPEAGMGIAAFDLENDGDVDLVLSHLLGESNTCYVNGGGLFEDRSAEFGLGKSSLAFTGFGIGAADFDQDGFQDLFVANGDVHLQPPAYDPADPYAHPDQLLRGKPGGGFEVLDGGPALAPRTSRGAAFGDLDGDGDVDIVVVDRNAPVRLLRNVVGDVAGGGVVAGNAHWIGFEVLDAEGRLAYDARVEVRAGSRSQWRQVQTAYSYLAASEPRVHFGLGSLTEVHQILVHWPRGPRESFGSRPAGQVHTLRAGAGN